MERFRALTRKLALLLLDSGIVAGSFRLGLLLRFQWEIPPEIARRWMDNGAWMVGLYLAAFLLCGLYQVLWQYAGVLELTRLTVAVGAANTAIYLIDQWKLGGILHNTVLCISGLLVLCLMGATRFGWRLVRLRLSAPPGDKACPVLIVGAGNAGAFAVSLCKGKKPLLMVDDDPRKQGLRVQGIPVRGNTEDIPLLVHRYGIREIIIAIPTLKGERLRRVVHLCRSTRAQVRMLSAPTPVEEGAALREVNTSDFLSREEVTLDSDSIRDYLTEKIVLVTGGGGSIGSELCRQIMVYRPKALLLFDICENGAYQVEMELHQRYGSAAPVTVLVGSIRDRNRLRQVFRQYRPQVVFHAAAHKHVPLMELSPGEAIKNNVLGTRKLLETAAEFGAERFVQLSTDKAVNPTSVMGCTKRLCELLLQGYARRTSMKCMAVRFGNVLGSQGSVIPLFEAQIRRGGPVTVTHPDITRYFMTIPEAAQLVLQAGGLAQSGSIYVLDMGHPVKILELAERLIRFYGYRPGVDMEIRITGLRPGEKLHEELLMAGEQERLETTAHNRIFVVRPEPPDARQLEKLLDRLEEWAKTGEGDPAALLAELVPDYHRPAD